VLLSGEAGIGKSRLTAALLERIATEPHTRLRYFCSPQHTDSALYPVIGQMERAAALAHGDSPQTKLDKLDALLAARGCLLALTGKSSNTVDLFTSTVAPMRSTGVTTYVPLTLSIFAYAYAQLGKYDDAWRCIDEAVVLMDKIGERWTEAETLRLAGEIAVLEPKPDAAKAERFFRRCSRAPAASKVLGTPHRNEHGAALARSG
jgi:hypothetical protein